MEIHSSSQWKEILFYLIVYIIPSPAPQITVKMSLIYPFEKKKFYKPLFLFSNHRDVKSYCKKRGKNASSQHYSCSCLTEVSDFINPPDLAAGEQSFMLSAEQSQGLGKLCKAIFTNVSPQFINTLLHRVNASFALLSIHLHQIIYQDLLLLLSDWSHWSHIFFFFFFFFNGRCRTFTFPLVSWLLTVKCDKDLAGCLYLQHNQAVYLLMKEPILKHYIFSVSLKYPLHKKIDWKHIFLSCYENREISDGCLLSLHLSVFILRPYCLRMNSCSSRSTSEDVPSSY